MGCVSSNLLNHDDDFSQIGGSGLGHHIVSLTSTTYGLLTLDPPPCNSNSDTTRVPPTRFTLGSVFPSPLSDDDDDDSSSQPQPQPQPSEVINSWELMAGLDTTTATSFRFSPPSQPSKPLPIKHNNNKENSNPNMMPLRTTTSDDKSSVFLRPLNNITILPRPSSVLRSSLDAFENLCPPNGENRVVIYTTTLRGIRKTFEDCNAVRTTIEGLGVLACERDISMDRGFKEELRELMKGKESTQLVPPRVFVKGRYMGGAEEVMRIVEQGCFGELLQGLPRLRAGFVCEGCGGLKFLPCFACSGSCKMMMMLAVKEEMGQQKEKRKTVVVRCPDCNENGLVLCPICS
ncbi:uncharacterized protein At3g28850-like [Cornus florida]|uniref:uncharacterized protein At3g28850-like n=1 Tax=Cornus florida TaxID=4283 RepID=UPI00289BBA61|nr:uncharacterized protein At3g28850-like [Cornus florida]